MMLVLFILLLFFFFYSLFIFWVYRQWKQLSEMLKVLPTEELPTLSVIVPVRNESANIAACLQSLSNQSYPKEKVELLVIDDFSTDNTASIVSRWKDKSAKLIRLADFFEEGAVNSFKKRAIETAIRQASGQFIVTTDADCIAPPDWLISIGSYVKTRQLKALAAPVLFFGEQSTLERFQTLDYMGMMALTAAGINSRAFFLCNGANFAYEREAFWSVGGFDGIDKVASGDDMLLLFKLAKKYPGQIGFLKNRKATVLTYPKRNIKSFFVQRLRWASKSKVYKDKGLLLTQGFVFSYCLLLVVLLVTGFFIPVFLYFFLIGFLIKFVTDAIYLVRLADFFKRKDLKSYLFSSQLLHVSYILAVGLGSFFISTYEWKGRRIK